MLVEVHFMDIAKMYSMNS